MYVVRLKKKGGENYVIIITLIWKLFLLFSNVSGCIFLEKPRKRVVYFNPYLDRYRVQLCVLKRKADEEDGDTIYETYTRKTLWSLSQQILYNKKKRTELDECLDGWIDGGREEWIRDCMDGKTLMYVSVYLRSSSFVRLCITSVKLPIVTTAPKMRPTFAREKPRISSGTVVSAAYHKNSTTMRHTIITLKWLPKKTYTTYIHEFIEICLSLPARPLLLKSSLVCERA